MSRRPAAGATIATRPAATAESREVPNAIVSILSRELDQVRALREAITEERRAVEEADATRLRHAAELIRERSRELADLERARERASLALGVEAGAPLEHLLARLSAGGPEHEGATRIGALLRQEAAEVARAMAVVRRAAERLAAHLAGVRATVSSDGAGVYGRRGRLAAGEGPLAVDLRH
ncbi:MAG: flagellar export chaperone FlgN [Phycisphaeraceae bacterium]|nr:flagellar export chaperone FlgN [Phycisphaeraceae bacterium]